MTDEELQRTCINCLKSPVERAGVIRVTPKGEGTTKCTVCPECAPLFTNPTPRTYHDLLPRAHSNLDKLRAQGFGY